MPGVRYCSIIPLLSAAVLEVLMVGWLRKGLRFAESCCKYFVGYGRSTQNKRTADDHRRRDRFGEEDESPNHGGERYKVGHGQRFAGPDVLN